MSLLQGICIKLHFSQCEETWQGLWGALRTSLHWLQWDTRLPKPRLRIHHSTPSPERRFVHLFVPAWNCQDLKLPLWQAAINPASPPPHQHLQLLHQGIAVCSRSILLPCLPLFYPSEKLTQHYISSGQQKAPCEHFYNFTLFKTAPIKELKIFLRSPG